MSSYRNPYVSRSSSARSLGRGNESYPYAEVNGAKDPRSPLGEVQAITQALEVNIARFLQEALEAQREADMCLERCRRSQFEHILARWDVQKVEHHCEIAAELLSHLP